MQELDRNTLFGRMLGIISQKELDLLARKTIGVPGAGGVGFTHAETLVRMGVGGVNIADFDRFGPENFNRQFGATVHTLGAHKAEVLAERLKSINPSVRIRRFEGISRETVDEFLNGVDVVCDAMDYFVIEPREIMYAQARARGIPIVVSGPVGFGATHHYFAPDGMSFGEYFDLRPEMSENDKLVNFGIGLAPCGLQDGYLTEQTLDFEARKVASVSSACLLATTLSATSAFSLLLGRPMAIKPVPYVYAVDYVAGKFEERHLPEGVRGLKRDAGRR